MRLGFTIKSQKYKIKKIPSGFIEFDLYFNNHKTTFMRITAILTDRRTASRQEFLLDDPNDAYD